MLKYAFAFLAMSAAALAGSSPSLAQPPAAVSAPATSKDPAMAPAGVYNLDIGHSSIVARIGHDSLVSFSTMRFGVTKAVLTWDPAKPSAIKLEAVVSTKAHYDPIVYRTTPDGPIFLNAEKFPEASFVSTGVTKTGPAKADVTGNLTLLGVTHPAVMHIEMVGTSKNNKGIPIVGFTGSMQIKRSDFGNAVLPSVGNDIMLELDGEFVKG